MDVVSPSPTIQPTGPSSPRESVLDLEKDIKDEKVGVDDSGVNDTTLAIEPVIDYGPPPEGGLRAWLVVFGVSDRCRRYLRSNSDLNDPVCGFGILFGASPAYGPLRLCS